MKTILDQVAELIERLAPDPVCDDCVADRLGLSVRQHANHKTRELAGAAGFERQIGECALCGATEKVIRKNEKYRIAKLHCNPARNLLERSPGRGTTDRHLKMFELRRCCRLGDI